MERLSRFVYGGLEFVTTVSVRPWVPADATVGGSRTSAAGVPASYVVRRDVLIELTMRFYESEWTSLLNLLAFGQSAEAFTWYPEASDTATSWEVYLEAPLAGDRIAPTRDSEFPRVMELGVTLRGAGTEAPWLSYFLLG